MLPVEVNNEHNARGLFSLCRVLFGTFWTTCPCHSGGTKWCLRDFWYQECWGDRKILEKSDCLRGSLKQIEREREWGFLTFVLTAVSKKEEHRLASEQAGLIVEPWRDILYGWVSDSVCTHAVKSKSAAKWTIFRLNALWVCLHHRYLLMNPNICVYIYIRETETHAKSMWCIWNAVPSDQILAEHSRMSRVKLGAGKWTFKASADLHVLGTSSFNLSCYLAACLHDKMFGQAYVPGSGSSRGRLFGAGL